MTLAIDAPGLSAGNFVTSRLDDRSLIVGEGVSVGIASNMTVKQHATSMASMTVVRTSSTGGAEPAT